MATKKIAASLNDEYPEDAELLDLLADVGNKSDVIKAALHAWFGTAYADHPHATGMNQQQPAAGVHIDMDKLQHAIATGIAEGIKQSGGLVVSGGAAPAEPGVQQDEEREDPEDELVKRMAGIQFTYD